MRALSPAARRTLDALCRRIAPTAYEPDVAEARPFDLADAVERRLAGQDGALLRRLDRVLLLFDHPATALATSGRPHRFTKLSPAQQDAVLLGWESSRVPARRTILQALRRVILAVCYTRDVSLRAIGYLGPYHRRAPVFAWEGPLAGQPSDGDPVARGAPSAPLPPFTIPSARSLPRAAVLRAKVCVIGSGAGGAVAAARLAEAGHEVIVLEEGPHVPREERDESEERMTSLLYADGGLRTTDDGAITLLQGRGIGGGSTINWMIMLRPGGIVMDEWRREHGAELLGEDLLSPALDRIESEVHARMVPADAHAPNNRVILDGAARLGWAAAPAAINARDCLRTGFCGLGCRYGAKQDAGEVYVRRAVAAGARVFADVRALRIERRGGGWRVIGRVLPEDSVAHAIAVECDVVVLAAGAVGTPVLLQRSGLGNPVVGRYLRLHPTTGAVGLYEREMYGGAGIPQSSVLTEFADRDGGYGFWVECPPMLPGLAAAALPGFGAEHRRRMREFPRLGTLIVLARDGAGDPRSQGAVRARRGGGISIRYRLRPPEWRMIDDGVRAALRLHLAAGATEAFSLHSAGRILRSDADVSAARLPAGANRVSLFSAHVNGTCRMGADAARHACTPEGELRGCEGVYIADGSLFPTAPGVNPQATIMALAALVAERINDRLPQA